MKDEDFNSCVIDSSFLLSYLLPDEEVKKVNLFMAKHEDNPFPLYAPGIIFFELANGLKSAVVSGRIPGIKAKNLLNTAEDLGIKIVELKFTDVLKEALKKDISVYDASYVYLAKKMKIPLFTLDKKLQRLVPFRSMD